MSSRPPVALVAPLLALAVGCSGALSLDAEAPHACLELSGQQVQGLDSLPAALQASSSATTTTVRHSLSVPFDSSVLSPGQGGETRVALQSLQLQAGGGATFAFVTAAEVSSDSTPLLTYPGGDTGSALEIVPAEPVDITALVHDDVLPLDLDLTGTLPAHGFPMDVAVCFDVSTQVGLVP